MRRLKRFSSRRNELSFRLAAILLPLIAAVVLLSQTALAQNTYVITDGERVVVHTTSTTDPAAVLNEAGLALGAADTYVTQGSDGVSEITIRRIQAVKINHCGQELTVEAHGESVQALLSRLGIVLDEDTAVSVPLDSLTFDGMELVITRTARTSESYTQRIPYKTNYYNDSALPEGTQVVVTPGRDGEMLCTDEVTYKNGVESDRNLVRQILSRPATDALIAVGTAAPVPAENPDDGKPAQPVITDRTIVTPTGETLTYTGSISVLASAYTNTDEGCDEWTATGTLARVGAIAVDPEVIPYGTRMYIVSDDGAYVYGIATAEDCGGAIGGNRVDLYFDTTAECFQFGMRDCTVYFLG